MTLAKVLLSRRRCGQVLAGAVFNRWFRRAFASERHLNWGAAPGPGEGHERRYRATAQILVLSLPLVRWSNVGGGSAVWRDAGSPDDGLLRFLEFTGFSNPEHAAGLNRLGFIREMSRLKPGTAAECLYFGLMTASPEETAEEARQSLHPKSKEAAYTAIDGHLDGAGMETVIAHFTAPANWSVANRNDLVQLARTALAATPSRTPEGDARGEIRPFLVTLADALRQAAPAQARFVYGGRFYRLSLQRSPDPKTTGSFRQRGLLDVGKQLVRVSGKLRRESGGKETDFRLWVEDGAAQPLPLRIEYQARSYLRLIFDAEA